MLAANQRASRTNPCPACGGTDKCLTYLSDLPNACFCCNPPEHLKTSQTNDSPNNLVGPFRSSHITKSEANLSQRIHLTPLLPTAAGMDIRKLIEIYMQDYISPPFGKSIYSREDSQQKRLKKEGIVPSHTLPQILWNPSIFYINKSGNESPGLFSLRLPPQS